MRQFIAAVVISNSIRPADFLPELSHWPPIEWAIRFAQFYLFIGANFQQRARAKSTIITMSIGHFVRTISIRHKNVSN